MIPPTRPAKNPPHIDIFPQPAVIATKPAIAPFNVWDKLGFPNLNHEVKSAPIAPAAAAMFVTITTFDAAAESSPPHAS